MNIRIVPEVFPPIEVQYEEVIRTVFPRWHRTVDRASRKVVVLHEKCPEHVSSGKRDGVLSHRPNHSADRLVYIISAMEVAQRRLDLKGAAPAADFDAPARRVENIDETHGRLDCEPALYCRMCLDMQAWPLLHGAAVCSSPLFPAQRFNPS